MIEENCFTLSMCAFSHTGKIREKNQDNLFFLGRYLEEENKGSEKLLTGHRSSKKPLLLGVCDGMGGYSMGERAAYLTVREMNKAARGGLPGDIRRALVTMEQICLKSNELVCRERETEHAKIGTTASMLFLSGKSLGICNIGDSPIFRIRNGKLETLYMEHTERLLKEVLLGREHTRGKKYPLTQHIGLPASEMLIEPYTAVSEAEAGDLYLICTDGLTDQVEENEILQILQKTGTAAEKVRELTRTALAAGGKDNITIILIQIE
ncbi:MAG: protein phosphatase 2C domain-containing protein [Lachnospiraceae bacterium]|nr:protein phosphatase 2C domain-containing protein [Lachnospiraceae bacterium]